MTLSGHSTHSRTRGSSRVPLQSPVGAAQSAIAFPRLSVVVIFGCFSLALSSELQRSVPAVGLMIPGPVRNAGGACGYVMHSTAAVQRGDVVRCM